MAPATHLSFPTFGGVEGGFEAPGGEGTMAQLALAMLQAELAVPQDWSSKLLGELGGAVLLKRFLERSLQRWVGTVGGDEIHKRWFGFNLALSNMPGDPLDDPRAIEHGAPTSRVFLTVWPQVGGHYAVAMEKPFALLAKADPRFPSMFWERFTGALKQYVTVWDFDAAIEEEEDGTYGEYLDQFEAEAEEGEESEVARPSRALPEFLKRKAVKDVTVRRILKERCYPPSDRYVGALMWGALELAELARGGDCGWSTLTDYERGAFMDHMGTPPSFLALMHDGDAFAHLWDLNGDSLWQAGGPFDPCCVWAFDATPLGVHGAFSKLEHFCKVMRKAGELIDRLAMPNPMLWSINDIALPEGDAGIVEALRLTVGAS